MERLRGVPVNVSMHDPKCRGVTSRLYFAQVNINIPTKKKWLLRSTCTFFKYYWSACIENTPYKTYTLYHLPTRLSMGTALYLNSAAGPHHARFECPARWVVPGLAERKDELAGLSWQSRQKAPPATCHLLPATCSLPSAVCRLPSALHGQNHLSNCTTNLAPVASGCRVSFLSQLLASRQDPKRKHHSSGLWTLQSGTLSCIYQLGFRQRLSLIDPS